VLEGNQEGGKQRKEIEPQTLEKTFIGKKPKNQRYWDGLEEPESNGELHPAITPRPPRAKTGKNYDQGGRKGHIRKGLLSLRGVVFLTWGGVFIEAKRGGKKN